MSLPPKLLRPAQVIPLYGTTKTKFYNDVAAGLMTRPIKLTPKLALWPEPELAAIAAARIIAMPAGEMRDLVNRLHEKRKADSAAVLAGV